MSNIKIKCQDCGEEFNFTERDQKFYEKKRIQITKKM